MLLSLVLTTRLSPGFLVFVEELVFGSGHILTSFSEVGGALARLTFLLGQALLHGSGRYRLPPSF